MSDPITEPLPDPVPDPVPDPPLPDPEPDPTPDPEPENHTPDWANAIMDRLDGILEAVKTGSPSLEPVLDPDEGPARKPWTHRGFASKD